MPMLAITRKIFDRPFWDTYHKKTVGMDSIARLLVSYQHLFFYPLMAVGRWNLYVQGKLATDSSLPRRCLRLNLLLLAGLLYLLLQPDKAHYRKTELFGLLIFFGWCSSVALAQPSWSAAVWWVLVSHAVAGLLHVQVAQLELRWVVTGERATAFAWEV